MRHSLRLRLALQATTQRTKRHAVHRKPRDENERPLYYHTALLQMPKGFPTTHFDMYGAEDLLFHKYDILSQRGLGHIKDAIDLVRENQEKEVNVHQVEKIKNDDRVRLS